MVGSDNLKVIQRSETSIVWGGPVGRSGFGTFRTARDVRLEPTKADVYRPLRIYRFASYISCCRAGKTWMPGTGPGMTCFARCIIHWLHFEQGMEPAVTRPC
jgi:hypothetical protein